MPMLFGFAVLFFDLAVMAAASGARLIEKRREKATQARGVAEELSEQKAAELIGRVILEDQQGRQVTFDQQKNGSYQMVKEESDLQAAQEMEQRLKQQYSYLKVRKEVLAQGYTIASEDVLEDTSIKLVVRRWS